MSNSREYQKMNSLEETINRLLVCISSFVKELSKYVVEYQETYGVDNQFYSLYFYIVVIS